MIRYSGKSRLKICQLTGSVFPRSAIIAAPCAAIAAVLEWLQGSQVNDVWIYGELELDPIVWGGLMSMVTFFLIFRTSIAYTRFWDGATSTEVMSSCWYDACSAACAFTSRKPEREEEAHNLKHLLVRLFSAMHALALAEVEDWTGEMGNIPKALQMEVIDVNGLDLYSLQSLQMSTERVLLVFQWIQALFVENAESTVLDVPPPILTRAFDELQVGMSAFKQAKKVAMVPFPFPYAQTCDLLLLVHWLVSPVMVMYFVSSVPLVLICCFGQVFLLSAINCIAVELENPFGHDANDLDFLQMQHDFNGHLLMLLSQAATRTPYLSSSADFSIVGDGMPRELGQGREGVSLTSAFRACRPRQRNGTVVRAGISRSQRHVEDIEDTSQNDDATQAQSEKGQSEPPPDLCRSNSVATWDTPDVKEKDSLTRRSCTRTSTARPMDGELRYSHGQTGVPTPAVDPIVLASGGLAGVRRGSQMEVRKLCVVGVPRPASIVDRSGPAIDWPQSLRVPIAPAMASKQISDAEQSIATLPEEVVHHV